MFWDFSYFYKLNLFLEASRDVSMSSKYVNFIYHAFCLYLGFFSRILETYTFFMV
jgi:hypothetical protein